MLNGKDVERLIDYAAYLPEVKKAERDAVSSRERQRAQEDREWYEAEIAALKAKLGRGQKKLMNNPEALQGQPIAGQGGEKICGVCGKVFTPNAPNQQCCDDGCRLEWRRLIWRDRVRALRDGERQVVGVGQEIACKRCGKVFKKKHPSNKYCSVACGMEADKERSKQCYVGRVRVKGCEMCGVMFSYVNRKRKYCGPGCMKRARGGLGEG